MNIRRLNEDDYPTLVKWWNDWGWTPLAKKLLPENGTGGVMIESENGTPICAGFLYITNSEIAWMEWVISNKEVRGKQRDKALDLLFSELILWAENSDRSVIFTVGKNKHFLERCKKFGFLMDEVPSFELIKTI